MDIRELDRRALALFGDAVAQVKADQLSRPTPCPDWTLRGLIRHQVSQNEGFAAAAGGGGEALPVWRSGDLGDDHVAATERSAELLTTVLADDSVLEAPFAIPEIIQGATFPGHIAISFHVVDCVIHAWDVAKSIGADWTPADDLIALSLQVAELVPEDSRGPGASFAGKVTLPADVAPRDHLLALLGRDPNWTP